MCGLVSNNVHRELFPNTRITDTHPSLKLVWSHDHTLESMLNVSDDVCSNSLTACQNLSMYKFQIYTGMDYKLGGGGSF